MMRLDKSEILHGVTVYEDEDNAIRYHLLAQKPRFRLDEQGRPVFKFIKYRVPIDRADGRKGGGFVIFDVEFVVPEDKLALVREELQNRVSARFRNSSATPPAVEIAPITFTRGTASILLLQDSGMLVQKINSPGKPSLFGNNVTPVTAELTPEGAAVVEKAMQGQGGVVQVCYDLFCPARLPPIKIRGRFHAEKFYSFTQTVDIEWNLWSEDEYHATIAQRARDSEVHTLDFDWGAVTDDKLKEQIRDWAERTMEKAVERHLIQAITPVSDKDREVPEDIEDVTRNLTDLRTSSFTLNYVERQTIEWNPKPQGTLPNITTLTDRNGSPFDWSQYAISIDADDPFFQEIRVAFQVNCDFANAPVHSVNINATYTTDHGEVAQGGRFSNTNDLVKCAWYYNGSSRKYRYSYTVNYKGESRTTTVGPIETDEPFPTINAGDLGFLSVEVLPGDLNFAQVQRAQVSMWYEDTAQGVDRFEQSITLDKDNKSGRFEKLIFARQNQPYHYQVKYFMENGREFQGREQTGRAPKLYINDVFSAIRTVSVRASGNLEAEITTIYVDLSYVDAANDYSQTTSKALSKAMPFFDWDFPVIDADGGTVTYSGIIQFKNGTEEQIPPTVATSNTILLGKHVEGFLEVNIVPDLVDFSVVRLAKVTLHYVDTENDIDKSNDFIFKHGSTATAKWTVELKDKKKTTYEWLVTFYLADHTTKTVGPNPSNGATIVLELPA